MVQEYILGKNIADFELSKPLWSKPLCFGIEYAPILCIAMTLMTGMIRPLVDFVTDQPLTPCIHTCHKAIDTCSLKY